MRYNTGLCIIVPVYNEQKTILEVIEQLIRMKNSIPNIDIIIVDDCSIDDTPKIISKLKDKYNIQIIRHRKNRGYGSSLKTGVRASKRKFTAFFDSDGQHRVDDLISLFNSLEDNDLVIGHRSNMYRTSNWRSPLKLMLKIYFTFILLKDIKDPTSGLRIWKTPKIESILSKCSDGFSFSASSLMVANLLDYKIKWCSIKMNKRESGVSQFRLGKIFKIFGTLFIIVISLKPMRIVLLITQIVLILIAIMIVTQTLG